MSIFDDEDEELNSVDNYLKSLNNNDVNNGVDSNISSHYNTSFDVSECFKKRFNRTPLGVIEANKIIKEKLGYFLDMPPPSSRYFGDAAASIISTAKRLMDDD